MNDAASNQPLIKRVPLTPESEFGWRAFRAGKNFDPSAFDARKDQTNYELGRLRAANVAAAVGRIPARQSIRLFTMAAALVGSAIPGETRQ